MDALFLVVAGLLAGGMNALAGGGSFVSLPALIASGVPSLNANATSTVALFPGGLASAWTYRDGLGRVCGVPLGPTIAATFVGGLAGAILLLSTPTSAFDAILPWLLLVATLTLAFGRRLGPWLRARIRVGLPVVLAVQFVLGIYGGYFGGAVGIMMVSAWSVLDGAEVKALNAPRTVMVSVANGVAIVCFALAGAVRWQPCLLVAIGAAFGGWGGAHLGRRLPTPLIRAGTLAVAVVTTTSFFWKAVR